MRPSAAPLVLLAVLVLAPLAGAQEATPVLVEREAPGVIVVGLGETVDVAFTLFNLNSGTDYYVSVDVEERSGWESRASPDRFFLEPRNETTLVVSLAADPRSEDALRFEGQIAFDVTFSFVHGATGAVTQVVRTVEVTSSEPPLVLGLFENPLPPPLDNAWGTFVVEMAFWIAIAVAGMVLGDTVVRAITMRASNTVTREILHKLRKPVFSFIVLIGLARSVHILPRWPSIEFVEKVLVAVAVGIFGLYVLYRVLDSSLLYYQRVVAPRTGTRVDDILVPLLRKVGIVVLYVVGIVVVLRRLGWDPTLVFAGAGIAGLVIAFAAQDTFSNLFSGIFLLLDQPFREGDDIQLETNEIVRVENIGLRTTRLYHPRTHESITVPNNQLATKRVVNLTGPDRRYWVMVDVGVAYGSDLALVRRTLLEVAMAHPEVTKDEGWAPLVIFKGFGASSLDMILRFGVIDYGQRFAVASQIRFDIDKAFRENGIEIPFPQRTVWVKEFPAREPAGE